jgi:ligand-binding SRPBCC domain-containing protein
MKFMKESRLRAVPGRVSAFHEAPGALARLTPPWERVKVVHDEGSIKPGSRVEIVTWMGLFPLRWVAEHTAYKPGEMFADRQIHGPFASWEHQHWFLDDGQGGTLLRDEIEFEPPLGRLGRLLAHWFIIPKLNRMFDYRHQRTSEIVESSEPFEQVVGNIPLGRVV